MSYTIEERDAAIEKAQKAVDKATEGRNGALERLRAHDETLGRALFRLRVAQIMPVEGVTPVYREPCVHDNPDEKRGVELVLPDQPGVEMISRYVDSAARGALADQTESELPNPIKFAGMHGPELPIPPGEHVNWTTEPSPVSYEAGGAVSPGRADDYVFTLSAPTTERVDTLPDSSLRAEGVFDNAAESEERVATDCTGPLPAAVEHDARVAADALAYEAKLAVNPFAGVRAVAALATAVNPFAGVKTVADFTTVVNPFASTIDAAAQTASRAAAQAVPGDVDLATALPEEKRARVEAALAAARAEQPTVNPFAGG